MVYLPTFTIIYHKIKPHVGNHIPYMDPLGPGPADGYDFTEPLGNLGMKASWCYCDTGGGCHIPSQKPWDPETNSKFAPEFLDGWKMKFLLGWPIFRCFWFQGGLTLNPLIHAGFGHPCGFKDFQLQPDP